jgi:integrase/recombinase XerD
MSGFIPAMEAYLDHCLSCDQSPRTVEGDKSRLNAFIRWCLAKGIMEPSAVTTAHLEAYRTYLYKEYKTKSGRLLDISTRRQHLTTVRLFLRRLKRTGEIAVDPGVELELPKVPRRLRQVWLTPDEAERVVGRSDFYGTRGLRDRAILEVFYATGIRRKELVALDIDDLNFRARTLKIRSGKGNHERYVPIAQRACDAAARYLKEVRPQLAKLSSGDALFLNNDGERYRAAYMSRVVKQYVARSGVPKKGACNLYRHGTATLMLEGGADIRQVQVMLGHADISTTQVYAHVAIKSLKEVYAKTHPAAAGGANGK